MFKKVIALLLLCNVFGIMLYCYNYMSLKHEDLCRILTITSYGNESEFELASKPEPKFDNPTLAFKVLSVLDPLKTKGGFESGVKTYLGLQRDSQYCEKHRANFVQHPETIFDQMNVVTSWAGDSFFTETVSPVANHVYAKGMNRDINGTQIRPEATSFFTTRSVGYFFTLHQQASCLSQQTNQIPGSENIWMKNKVAASAFKYVTQYKDKPQCINYDKFFPESWLLANAAQCREFFSKMLSPEYAKIKEERKIVYMKKLPEAHRGLGVQPVDEKTEMQLRKTYEDGALCGKVKRSVIMQNYIHNGLLLNGHKFDFRMYMLIASTNPTIAFYYDGLLRVSLGKYDANSKDKKVLLTNLILNKQIYDDAKKGILYEGKNEEELKLAQQWSFDQLQSYLLDTGVIRDLNWLDNYLRPEFQKAMIHLVRMGSNSFRKHSSFYGLYGVDFMLDTNLNLWFIETNAAPAFGGYSEPMGKFVGKMLLDHYEVMYSLLRSRMKRVVDFVNEITANGIAYETEDGEVKIQDLDLVSQMFKDITKNKFEKDFPISADNKFVKIIDENEEGAAKYMGLIPGECL